MKEISAEPSSPLPPDLVLRDSRAAFLSSSYTMNCIAPCDTCKVSEMLRMLSSACDQIFMKLSGLEGRALTMSDESEALIARPISRVESPSYDLPEAAQQRLHGCRVLTRSRDGSSPR